MSPRTAGARVAVAAALGGQALTRRTAARLAWSVWAITVVITALGMALFFLNRSTPLEGGPGLRGIDAAHAVALLAFPTVGALIASRRPDNPIGWIFCPAGPTFGGTNFSTEYGVY